MDSPNSLENKCSFCGRSREEAELLIAGQDAFICNQCASRANQIVQEEFKSEALSKAKLEDVTATSPKEIKHYLDAYVIDQDKAKRVLSVAIYNHYKRLKRIAAGEDVLVEKSNILLVGKTGTGKTLLAKSIAKKLDLPFTIVDATVFTEAGYVGEDVESMLSRLLQVCDYDVRAAERGIVFIDEIDKIARRSDNPSLTRDVSGEGVQQSVLKLLEGADVLVPPQGGRKHPEQKLVKINTSQILFICGGAFDGIEKKIASRINRASIGFANIALREATDDDLLSFVQSEDLLEFGLIPELIGRLPVLVHLNPLSEHALQRILTEPKNALIKQYQELFAMDDVELEFEKEAIQLIAEVAIRRGLGARGLRNICEKILLDWMFELPMKSGEKVLTVTKDHVTSKLKDFAD